MITDGHMYVCSECYFVAEFRYYPSLATSLDMSSDTYYIECPMIRCDGQMHEVEDLDE